MENYTVRVDCNSHFNIYCIRSTTRNKILILLILNVIQYFSLYLFKKEGTNLAIDITNTVKCCINKSVIIGKCSIIANNTFCVRVI